MFIQCVNKTDNGGSCHLTELSLIVSNIAGHPETAFRNDGVGGLYRYQDKSLRFLIRRGLIRGKRSCCKILSLNAQESFIAKSEAKSSNGGTRIASFDYECIPVSVWYGRDQRRKLIPPHGSHWDYRFAAVVVPAK
jgi:hypothetical protein